MRLDNASRPAYKHFEAMSAQANMTQVASIGVGPYTNFRDATDICIK